MGLFDSVHSSQGLCVSVLLTICTRLQSLFVLKLKMFSNHGSTKLDTFTLLDLVCFEPFGIFLS